MQIVPTPKQMEFLSASEDIVLFGGAVAGGKTWAILIDALGLNNPSQPRVKLSYYRALLVRRNYNHLTDMIDKSKNIFPLIDKGAIFNHSELVWKFSSGAQIRFDYFENIQQAEAKLIGKEFAFIGIDEIGLYESDEVMRFSLSRLRSPNNLKCFLRATCNPSKFSWLQEFFRIPDNGSSTKFTIENVMPNGKTSKQTVRYIQSKLTDNPYIGEDYMEKLMILNEADREALINGIWGTYLITDAMVYKTEFKQMSDENRITTVPYQQGHDVYIAFDLGFGDNMAYVVFQLVGKEIQIIDCYQNNGKAIPHYVDLIKQKYNNVTIILPHDAKQHSLHTGSSTEQIFQEHFSKVEVLKAPSTIEIGIQRTKSKFQYVYISKNCEALISAIKCYERYYDAKHNIYKDPIHNQYSHMADAFRYALDYEKSAPMNFNIPSYGRY